MIILGGAHAGQDGGAGFGQFRDVLNVLDRQASATPAVPAGEGLPAVGAYSTSMLRQATGLWLGKSAATLCKSMCYEIA